MWCAVSSALVDGDLYCDRTGRSSQSPSDCARWPALLFLSDAATAADIPGQRPRKKPSSILSPFWDDNRKAVKVE